VPSGILLSDPTNFTATVLFGLNPFAFMTTLKPGHSGPWVGEISTLGSAKTVINMILANPKMPNAIIAEISGRFPIRYIFQDNIILLTNKNYGIPIIEGVVDFYH
jgi:hypothetical protein